MFINKIINKGKSVFTNLELRIIKKRALHYGQYLLPAKPSADADIVIENFFKTSHKKNALLSYIIYPFLGGIKNNHSNNKECYTIAEILNELGYNVDVINWNNTSFLPLKAYDLVIDNHNNLERLSAYLTNHTKKVFHATNAHWLYQNRIEYSRYYTLFLKQGIAILPPRLLTPGNSAEYCDVISMFGNEFTRDTYGKYSEKVYQLPMSVTSSAEIITDREYSSAKTRFIWLNSHGALLKGLDIVIDAFVMLPEFELYICGYLDRDTQFINSISELLIKARNIKIPGWVDIESEDFRKMAATCAFVISASFSEGGGGSILNCMAKGLIPIISTTSSLTLHENMGFYLTNNTANDLAETIRKVSSLPDADLRKMSFNVFNFIKSNHTIENFKKRYKEFLVQVDNGHFTSI